MYFPDQFSVRSTRKKYLGYPFLLQGAQKVVEGREKKYPTFFLKFFLGTQKILGGGGGGGTSKVTPLSWFSCVKEESRLLSIQLTKVVRATLNLHALYQSLAK